MSNPVTSLHTGHPGSQASWRAAALSLLLALAPAQGAEIIDAELEGDLLEHHAPEVNVSGNVIVGVMAASAYQALADDHLAIHAPDTGNTALCLKVTSRDGAYTSRNDYTSNSAPAILRLPYKSRIRKTVEQYTSQPGYIAITATRGDCEQSAPSDYYLPAVLDEDRRELGSEPLSIYINGFDATDVYYRIIDSDDSDFRDCDYIEEGRHTAYNFSCVIPDPPTDMESPLTIEIMREVYGRELEPLTIRILATR